MATAELESHLISTSHLHANLHDIGNFSEPHYRKQIMPHLHPPQSYQQLHPDNETNCDDSCHKSLAFRSCLLRLEVQLALVTVNLSSFHIRQTGES